MKIYKEIVYAMVLLAVLCIAEASFAFKCSGILHDQFGNLIANKTIRIELRKDDAGFVTKTDSKGFFSIEKKDKLMLWWFYYKMDTDSGYGYLFDRSNPGLFDYVLCNDYSVADINKLVNITGEKLDSTVLKILISNKKFTNHDSLFLELFKINDHVKQSVLKAISNRYARSNAVEYLLYLGDLDLLNQVLEESRYWAPKDHFRYSSIIMSLNCPIPNDYDKILNYCKKELGHIPIEILYALALNPDPSAINRIQGIDKNATDIIIFKGTYPSAIPFDKDINTSIKIALQLIPSTPYDHAGINKQTIKSIIYDRTMTNALVVVFVGDFSGCEYVMSFHRDDNRWALKYLQPTFSYN